MNNVKNYLNIANDNRNVSEGEKIRTEFSKLKSDITFESFKSMFYRWKKGQNKVKKSSVAKPVTKNFTSAERTGEFDAILSKFDKGYNPLGLPESLETEYKPFKLPKNHNDILLLSDIHIPYHNIPALTIAIEYGIENNVNTILLNGDLIDFYAISRFQKDPRKRNLAREILLTREFLQMLRRLFPKAAIYYKCGNHDARWDHYIMNNAPDLLGLDEFNFESVMQLDKLDITYIPDKQLIHAGKLTILHGHELMRGIFSPVNVARGLFNAAKADALVGHHHQHSEHSEPNINGKLINTYSVACLSELHPDYAPINKYAHGFAHVKVFENEDYEVNNYKIINGKIT